MDGYLIRMRVLLTEHDCDNEEITRGIGITPTGVWNPGDLVYPRSVRVHTERGWYFQTEKIPNKSLDEVWEEFGPVLDVILSKKDTLPIGTDIIVRCLVKLYTVSAPIGFTSNQLKQMAELDAYFDLDYYDLREK